jgi:hypothetical protein
MHVNTTYNTDTRTPHLEPFEEDMGNKNIIRILWHLGPYRISLSIHSAIEIHP